MVVWNAVSIAAEYRQTSLMNFGFTFSALESILLIFRKTDDEVSTVGAPWEILN